MAKYHINGRGEPVRCKAILRGCPLGGDHYDSKDEARTGYEAKQAHASEALKGIKSDSGENLRAWESLGRSDHQGDELDGALAPRDKAAMEDRSAGRWCEVCRQHGSHHTDMHDEFAPQVSPLEARAADVFLAMATPENRAEWQADEPNSFWHNHSKRIQDFTDGKMNSESFASLTYMSAAGERAKYSQRVRDTSARLVAARYAKAMNDEYRELTQGSNVESLDNEPFGAVPGAAQDSFKVGSESESELKAAIDRSKVELDRLKPMTEFYDARFTGSDADRQKLVNKLLG